MGLCAGRLGGIEVGTNRRGILFSLCDLLHQSITGFKCEFNYSCSMSVPRYVSLSPRGAGGPVPRSAHAAIVYRYVL